MERVANENEIVVPEWQMGMTIPVEWVKNITTP